ncbi:hypothetical protein HPB48_022586 [Haemaphysalis longicornis]|uniref:Uncharacterized protein n=1 Tax=Haemaphysalis longicornis TaxID=44386 RepID=A0A9J6G1Z2_HAELO|nr:hypothetical protein HPB48_022586 [Haemaphysalis longicornis]
MALSRPVFNDTSDDGELQFLTALAVKQAAIYQLQMQQQHLQAEIEEIDEELRQTAKRRKLQMAASCAFAHVSGVCGRTTAAVRGGAQDTNMRRAIPLDKRVAIGLYRLAKLMQRRELHLEHLYIKFPRPCEMAEHLRQFEAVLGFPRELVPLTVATWKCAPPQ